MSLLEPEQWKRLDRSIRIVGSLAVVLIAVGVAMAAFVAPTLADRDCALGAADCITSVLGQKIFYFHVPVAIGAYFALTILAFASYMHLGKERPGWDALAVGAAEVGVLLAAVTLYTGSLWGHLEWGSTFGYWSNDDTKLVLTLVLFLVYTGYLVLRRQIDDPRRRGRIAAVYALLGFATVPLSYMAQRIWRSRHPTVFDPGDPNSGLVTPWVQETFSVNVVAMVVLVAFLLLVRFRLEARRIDARATAGGSA